MATNIAALNTVYNHFMTAYAPLGTNTKYDTHKKSELRGVYNSIVKMNKDAPLFLLDTSPTTQEYAVSIKEGARSLRNVISSVTPEGSELLSRKTVSSSDESIVTASYIGDEEEVPVESFDIEVKQLASKQVNIGSFLPEEEMGLEPGTYSFDVNSRDADYEFQFSINENDTNRTIEDKLARLITKSNIGIQARTVSDGDGNVGLILESDESGVREGTTLQFRISDDKTSKTNGTVSYFGLDNIEVAPENSLFMINGEEKSTQFNKFTVENAFEITLNGISEEGKTTQIGLKTDIESLTDNISHLIEGYNSFINKAAQYLDSQPYSGRLVKEMGAISSIYGKELSGIGLNVNEDGTISLNKDALADTAQAEDALEKFSSIRSFTGSVLDKVNKVALNPMDYTQKTIVAYKNPGKSFVSPYVTSNYSGMMFSSYC